MNQDLIDATVALADALTRENEALTRLDLARAAAMLGAKRRAAAAFEEARAAALQKPGHDRPAVAGEVERQLAALAEENRLLLERGIRVQRRIIGAVAAALPRSEMAGGYRADGALTPKRRTPAFALFARV